MSQMVEVDERTFRSLEFAAHMANTTAGDIVARLVADASARTGAANEVSEQSDTSMRVAVYADYAGHRTHGKYDRTTKRIDITSGPLTGQSFKSPTGAARAVVAHYKPKVSSNRNGWAFWILDDGSGGLLQTIRWSS